MRVLPPANQWNYGIGGQNNWKEFRNDTYLLRELLTENIDGFGFHYNIDHIYVLFADGNDYDPLYLPSRYIPVQPITFAEASYDKVYEVLNGLATGGIYPILTDKDFLLFGLWVMLMGMG